jgi:CheY-like chemotaxis protein
LERQLGTILVVEDEAFISLVVSDELEDAGYHVLTAGNADQAIALLEKHEVRYIFTDIDMPGGSMDGLKLAAAVRHRWPPIAIIITTGKSEPQPHQMPAGSVFLPKPYRARAVIEAVRQF